VGDPRKQDEAQEREFGEGRRSSDPEVDPEPEGIVTVNKRRDDADRDFRESGDRDEHDDSDD